MGLDATIYDVKRATKEKKERVASARGSGTLELAYTTRKIVATATLMVSMGLQKDCRKIEESSQRR